MNTVVVFVLAVVAIPAVLACAYLLVLTLLSQALTIPPSPSRDMFFDVIVPAHNEAAVIERTVASLRQLEWPSDKYRILVVADNCSDATASLARAAGAEVIERYNDAQRGKGYALAYAFQKSRETDKAHAVVVIDADAAVSCNLLDAFAARISQGSHAVQAHYGVLNPDASWRTRLITIAKASFHIVRSRARERLGLSCGIRGNGWCITHELLQRVPYQAFSLTEDLEYGIDLGLAGYRVAYADEAHSNAEMVSGEQVASKQRQRWEGGRFQLIRSKTLPLLTAAAVKRSKVCLDLGLDLLVLPLSYVVMNVIALFFVSALTVGLGFASAAWLWLAVGCAASLLAYVLRGWRLSGIGLRGLIDLARAPAFLLWKIVLMFRPRRAEGWVRTDRERP
jgi:cellulose synthase/poly-beta-1,6-N-acetylglucosamine synthase-like glycosyltransferase